MMETVEDVNSMKETAQKALQANKDHQYALKVYTERLETELRTIDKLLDTADVADEDEEPELDVGGFVLVPNSVKLVFPIAPSEILSENSPFREDAQRRIRYFNNTAIHPMKARELEVLAEAVRTENHRKRALDAQKGGLPSFTTRDDKSQDFFEWNTEGIDWDRVAEKVSSVASLPRTARDCAIRWLGDRHPQFVHTSWTPTELASLQTLIKNAPEGPIDWVEIASGLGNTRTPLDCMRHGIHRKQHTWTHESDNALLNAVSVYGTDNWILVARHVSEDATPQQCQNRYSRTLDPTIRRGAWTAEEDAKLRLAVNVFGNSWVEVAEVIAGRTNEQCRDRWSDKINPTLARGKWTDEEDKSLLEAVSSLGTSNWKSVSERLGNGRTDHNCRSRYDKLRQKNQKKPKASTDTPGNSDSQTSELQTVDNDQPGTQIQEAGPSSVPARPRARTKKAPAAEPGRMDQGEWQSAEHSRPRPQPRAKKDKETASQEYDTIDSGPTPQAISGEGKGKGKQKATAATSSKVKATRKRKSRIGGDTGDNPPTKRRKSDPAVIRESAEKPVATLQATGDDHMNTSTFYETAAPDQLDIVHVRGQGDEGTSAEAMLPAKAPGTKSTREPTRRQPSRAASRKSIL